jgi:acyl-coenzyme A synthetase/AMP-(fatty) acid ligase
VAAGYLPEPDGSLAGGRFRASDLGAWAGGELALRGRIDDLVNVKGKKVNPREVEAVLARLHGVVEVAVLGVPHPATGSETLRAVVACSRGRLNREEIVGWCREHLSGHKVPRSVILVDRLPRTARGKLDQAALRGLTADRGHG